MGTIIGEIYKKYEEYEDICDEHGLTCLPIQEKGWLEIYKKYKNKESNQKK